MEEKDYQKRTSKLLNGMLIYGLGIWGSKAISFFLLPLNTAKLLPSEYGVTDVISVVISLLMPFATLQLGMTMYKKLLIEQDEQKKSAIISSGFFTNLVCTTLIAIVSVPISRLFYPELTLIIALLILFGGMNTTLLPVMRGLYHNGVYALCGCISTVVVVAVNAGLLLLTPLRIEAVLLSTLASNVVTVAYMCIASKIWKYFRAGLIEKKVIIELLRFGIPMIPRDICWWINNSFNRLILNRFKGDIENGYFVVTQKFTNLYGNTFGIVSMAWNDSAIQNAGEKDREEYYNAFYKQIFRVMLCIYLLILPMIHLLYDILVNEQYHESLKYIPLLMIAMVMNQYADLYASIFLSINNTKIISTTALLSTVVGAIVGILFIPKYGIWGIAFSSCTSSLVMLIVRARTVKREVNIRFPIEDLWLTGVVTVYIVGFQTAMLQIPLLIIAFILTFLLNKVLVGVIWNYALNLMGKLLKKFKR